MTARYAKYSNTRPQLDLKMSHRFTLPPQNVRAGPHFNNQSLNPKRKLSRSFHFSLVGRSGFYCSWSLWLPDPSEHERRAYTVRLNLSNFCGLYLNAFSFVNISPLNCQTFSRPCDQWAFSLHTINVCTCRSVLYACGMVSVNNCTLKGRTETTLTRPPVDSTPISYHLPLWWTKEND